MCKEALDACRVISDQLIDEHIFRYKNNTYSIIKTEAEKTFEKQIEDIKNELSYNERITASMYYENRLRSQESVLLDVLTLVSRFKQHILY